MNQLLHNEPRQDQNSICAMLLAGAERELAALFSPVAELFGPAVVRMWTFRNLKGARFFSTIWKDRVKYFVVNRTGMTCPL